MLDETLSLSDLADRPDRGSSISINSTSSEATAPPRSDDQTLSRKRYFVTSASLFVLAVLSLILAAAAVAAPLIMNAIVRSQAIASSPPLRNTPTGNALQFPMHSGEFYFYFYAWNVTNPSAIVEHGAKPIIKEVGPFVYRRTKHRINVTWDNDADTMSFSEWEPHHFVREASVSDDRTAIITTIDFVFLAAMLQTGPAIYKLFYEAQRLADGFDDTKLLFTKQTVRDLVTGYDRSKASGGGTDLAAMRGFLPNLSMSEWLGNTTLSAPTTLRVGARSGDLNEVTVLVEYHGAEKQRVPCPYGNVGPVGQVRWCPNANYADPSATGYPCCGDMDVDVWGSAAATTAEGVPSGYQFVPYALTPGTPSQPTRTTVWSPGVLRAVPLVNVGEYIAIHGVQRLLKFTLDPQWLNTQNVLNPEGSPQTFYAFDTPDGVLNLTVLKYGAPVFNSMPHFLHGSAELQAQVLGQHPENEKHETIVAVHPETGSSLMQRTRYQVNALIRPIHFKYDDLLLNTTDNIVNFLPHLNENGTYLPVAWIEERDEILMNSTAPFQLLAEGQATVVLLPVVFGIAAQLFCIGLIIVLGLFCSTVVNVKQASSGGGKGGGTFAQLEKHLLQEQPRQDPYRGGTL